MHGTLLLCIFITAVYGVIAVAYYIAHVAVGLIPIVIVVLDRCILPVVAIYTWWLWGTVAQWSEHLREEALGLIPSSYPGFFFFHFQLALLLM